MITEARVSPEKLFLKCMTFVGFLFAVLLAVVGVVTEFFATLDRLPSDVFSGFGWDASFLTVALAPFAITVAVAICFGVFVCIMLPAVMAAGFLYRLVRADRW